MIPVNFWAVLVSAILSMVIGYLWYGPLLGKQWVASMGWSEAQVQERMKSGSMWSYLWMFIGAFIMAFVLAHAIIFAESFLGFGGWQAGVAIGFANWVGFVAPSSISGVLFEGKPWKWWFIAAGFWLVTLVVMGIVLAVWL
ncbi:MAG TPA: DUF1761 domain-containing protein [Candidatus Paceibacterota bacterium]|jgi:hypothetical protein|nr:DUF1761 domain-containing protein [Candidatus Paceibacterota bacterium]